MTAAELAERLGVKAETVLLWHRNGRIPSRKLSHKILRFSLADVVAALEARPEAEGQGVAQ
jgi:excisionase family DNA binding protein